VGQAGVAPREKKATRLRACLVFVDESGLLMAPFVRRSWAPRGHTPLLSQRTRTHQKLSIIAALCVSPRRDRVHLYFRLHPQTNIATPQVIDFLRQLRRQVRSPLVLVWDRLRAHRSKSVSQFVEQTPSLHTVLLPPYAPELNPVEMVWGYLQTNPLANSPFFDLPTLTATSRHHGRRLQRRQLLLRSFIRHGPLPVRLR
jgi:transposase